MQSDMALLDAPPRPSAARAAPAALRLTVAGTAWSLPMDAVRAIAEAGPVTPLPLALADPPVEGIAGVEGWPILQIDLARALGGPPGASRVVVVVAVEAGDLALRVDDARREEGGESLALDLAGLCPWAGDWVFAGAPPRPQPAAVATLPLLRVRQGADEIALRIDRLERIDRPDWTGPLPESADSLVTLGDALLPARSLAPGPFAAAPYALVLRGDSAGDSAGDRAALLVERAQGVERCPLDRLATVRHPDGSSSLWWRRGEGAPLRVVDPGPLFGWAPGTAVSRPPESGREAGGVLGGGRPEVLVAEIAGHAVAFPLALVAGVEEPDVAGGGPRLRLAGRRRPLRLDRARPLEAGAADWRALTALPPAAALLFDAARWDAVAGGWLLRANVDTLTQFQGKRVAWAAKRALAAAWRRAERRP